MMILPSIFLIFLRLQIVFSTSNSFPIYGQWSNDQNGKYENNLQNLLGNLSSKTSTGFYNFSTTPSKTPNQLHGLYACRGDVDLETCRSCIDSAKNYILKEFHCSHKGLVWFDHCMLRYSNESFFGKWDQKSYGGSSSWQGRKVRVNRIHFTIILMKTMKELAIKASQIQNKNKYATKVVEVSRNESLYATVQCTPDLLAKDCYRCLTYASHNFLHMNGSVDGQALNTSCMAEYKTTSYYDGLAVAFATLPLSPSIEHTTSTLISVKGTNADDANDTSQRESKE